MTERCLDSLSKEGWARLDPGPFGGWALTDSGRVADDAWVARELEGLAARDRVLDCYRRFLELNPRLLEICSAWQMRSIGGSPTLNDHSDEDYDAGVLSRLFRLDDSAQDLITELATALSRFAVYGERLSSSVREVMAGSHAYLADGLESYHSVWFQLHEDLLTTLGISRGDERRQSGSDA